MPEVTTAKAVLSITALYGGVGAFIADWNATHIYNPTWPPHAKFHNAQTMSLGAGLGLVTLAVLWGPRSPWSAARLQVATAVGSLYCASQLSALAYPGTALIDPPSTRKGPQAYLAAGILALHGVAYLLDRRALRRR